MGLSMDMSFILNAPDMLYTLAKLFPIKANKALYFLIKKYLSALDVDSLESALGADFSCYFFFIFSSIFPTIPRTMYPMTTAMARYRKIQLRLPDAQTVGESPIAMRDAAPRKSKKNESQYCLISSRAIRMDSKINTSNNTKIRTGNHVKGFDKVKPVPAFPTMSAPSPHKPRKKQ